MKTQIEATQPDLRPKLVRVVARAWMEPSYRERLLDGDAKEALEEEDIEIPRHVKVTVVQDTATELHLILADQQLPPESQVHELPPQPNWNTAYAYAYTKALEDPAFKAKLEADPTGTIRSLGVQLPPETKITILHDTENQRYFQLPMAPRTRVTMELTESGLVLLDSSNVNANVTVNGNAAINGSVAVNAVAAVNVAAATQVAAAAAAAVVVAVVVLI